MSMVSKLKEIVGERNYYNMRKIIKDRFGGSRVPALIAINPVQSNFKYFVLVQRGVIRQLLEGNRRTWEISSEKKGIIVINMETGSILLSTCPNIIWS